MNKEIRRNSVCPIAPWKTSLLAMGFALYVVATAGAETSGPTPALIPLPQKIELGRGTFQLNGGRHWLGTRETSIEVDGPSRAIGEFLAARLRIATGYKLLIVITGKAITSPGNILLTTADAKSSLGPEGYELSVSPDSVVIRAPAQAGLFYGEQTLLQMFPAEVYSSNRVQNVKWKIPCAHIEDSPRFKWRGCMLDVSRHFFDKAQVERLLDLMAQYKLNVFQMHLGDEQGWRIQIKQYPRLTQVGAWRPDIGWKLDPKSSTAYGPDGRYGGFFTQDDIRDLVNYAQDRHILIVPEIEMPGHSGAAIRAYTNLNCIKPSGNPAPPYGVYCAGNEETFTFLENVLTEIFALFPGKYVHIGGDEVDLHDWNKCPRCKARMQAEGLTNANQLEAYFIKRIETFATSKGKTLIGWSEILNSNLASDTVLMDWIGGGQKAANSGHDVVMSPTSFCYMDYYQSLDRKAEPIGIGGYLPLWRVYRFDPMPGQLTPESQSHILGGQANMWTEFVPSLSHLDYMLFPRLCALAETVWSPAATRNWIDFCRRLETDEKRLVRLGVNYRREPATQVGQWTSQDLATNQPLRLQWDVTKTITGAGQYHVILECRNGDGLKIESIALLKNGVKISSDDHPGLAASRPDKPVYILELPAREAAAKYSLQVQVAAGSGTNSEGIVYGELHPEAKN